MTFSGTNLLAALSPALCGAADVAPSTPEASGGQASPAPSGEGQLLVSWGEAFAPFLEAALPAGEDAPTVAGKSASGAADSGARPAVSAARREPEPDEGDPARAVLMPAITAAVVLPLQLPVNECMASPPAGDPVPPAVPEAPKAQETAPAAAQPASATEPHSLQTTPAMLPPLACAPPAAPPNPEPEEVQGDHVTPAVVLPPAPQPTRAAPESRIDRVEAGPALPLPESEISLLAEFEHDRSLTVAAPKAVSEPRVPASTPSPNTASTGGAAPEALQPKPADVERTSETVRPSPPPAGQVTAPKTPVALPNVVPGRPQPTVASTPASVVAEEKVMPARTQWAFAARIVAAAPVAGHGTAQAAPTQTPKDGVQASPPNSPAEDLGPRPAPSGVSVAGGVDGKSGQTSSPQAAGEDQSFAGGLPKPPTPGEGTRKQAEKSVQPGAARTVCAVARQPRTERAGEIPSAMAAPPQGPDRRSSSPAEKVPAGDPQPPRSAVRAEESTAPGSPAPPREMRFRLAETGRAPSVEVRVKDQVGELRVAVRTPDGTLTRSLREGLPELVERLGQQGYETQVWKPGGSGSPPDPGGTGSRTREADFSGGPGNQGRPGGGQDGSGDGRGSKHQEQAPAWAEEWQTSFGEVTEP